MTYKVYENGRLMANCRTKKRAESLSWAIANKMSNPKVQVVDTRKHKTK